MRVVLFEPEIAPNTGNVARLCAATNSPLHLIEPLGFKLDDKRLKRAGMDYWRHVRWRSWPRWSQFHSSLREGDRVWYVESGGPIPYDQIRYQADDYLVFGRESYGLPQRLLESHAQQWIRIPMLNPHSRSLNLSNCVALVLFEGLRQLGFPGDQL